MINEKYSIKEKEKCFNEKLLQWKTASNLKDVEVFIKVFQLM